MRNLHTIPEAADILRLHKQTVYRMCWDGLLGSEKHGRKRFVPDEDLQAYRRANRYPAKAEADDEADTDASQADPAEAGTETSIRGRPILTGGGRPI